MFKKTAFIRLLALTAAVFMTPAIVMAGQAPKIGYVVLQKIVFDSKAGKAGIAEIKSFQEARQKEISDKEQELLKAKKEFEAQQFTLTDDAKKIQAERIQEMEIKLKRLLEDSDRDLRKRRNQLLEKINRDVSRLIERFGKENGYSFLFQRESDAVLYVDPKLEVTDKIIALYDKSGSR